MKTYGQLAVNSLLGHYQNLISIVVVTENILPNERHRERFIHILIFQTICIVLHIIPKWENGKHPVGVI